MRPEAAYSHRKTVPPQNGPIDKKIGVRIDKGEPVNGKPGFLRLKLQVNKGADDPTLKKLADENWHKVWATVDVDTNQEATEENLGKIFQELEDNIVN